MSAAKGPDIAQLKELPLPPPVVSYLPQTWGWLVLALVLLALLGVGLLLWHRRRQRERYRHEALRRLDELEQAVAAPGTRIPALRELPELLKRVALSMPDAPAVARLGGEEWQAFLQRHGDGSLPLDFTRQLALLAYAPESRVQSLADSEVQGLLRSSRQWIEAHHVAV